MAFFFELCSMKHSKFQLKYSMSIGLILAIFNFSFGYLDIGDFEIETGQGIDFSDQETAFVRTAGVFASNCGFYDSCCVDSLFETVDISYFNTEIAWDDFGCCSGSITGFRSFDTIWTIKDFSRIDFVNTLTLTDTTIFGLAKKSGSCNTWVATTFADAGGCWNCYRPNLQTPYFIIKNRMRQYVLLRIVAQALVRIASGRNFYGAKIACYLQRDGSLNFNDSSLDISGNSTTKNPNMKFSAPCKIVLMWPGKNMPALRFFDCRGRMIKTTMGSKSQNYQILIQRNN